jgi:hypothetical protein
MSGGDMKLDGRILYTIWAGGTRKHVELLWENLLKSGCIKYIISK